MYGGTERIVSYLTEELVAQGHDVTLFASGDSQTSARLVPACPTALRLADCVDPIPIHLAMLEEVVRQDFDVVHFHVDYLSYPLTAHLPMVHVTTLHGRLDLPSLVPLYDTYHPPVVSISDAQRAPLPDLDWCGTVYHGFPLDLYSLGEAGGDYLAFVGRISPEKRVDRAIEIARRAGRRILVAAKIDRADRDYYDSEIAALMREPHIEFLGEVGEADKHRLLGGARALLFPIDWPEPFGMVMAEAMACGTPVIGFRRGSVPEVIDDGVTGIVCDDIDGAVAAVERIGSLSRAGCRARFEARFSAARMVADYVRIYHQLGARHGEHLRGSVRLLHPCDEHAGGRAHARHQARR